MEKKKKEQSGLGHMAKNRNNANFKKANSHAKGNLNNHSHRTTNK